MDFGRRRRTAIERLMHDRSARLAAGLAIAVAIPVAILFYFQVRSISALSQTSAVVLSRLSEETADATTKALTESLRRPYIDVLLRIGQRLSEPLALPTIQAVFEQGLAANPFVDRFYVWSDLTADHKDDVQAFDRVQHAFIVNPPEGAWLVRQCVALARQKSAIAIFDDTLDGRATHFQVQLRFPVARDRLTSFLAMSIDAERLRREFIPRLVASRVANAGGPTGFPPLAVTVLDGDFHVVYPPGGSASDRFVDERTFQLVFFEPVLVGFVARANLGPEIWRVRTGYGGQTIPEIVAARGRPQYAMMVVLAGVMAVGVFVIARATAREVRAARLLEIANLRTGIALDLHDDIGSNLTKISILSEVARQQHPVPAPTDDALSAIAGISRDSAAAMSDIVWAINPERDQLIDLLQRMRRHAEEMCISRGLTLSFEGPSDERTIHLDIDMRRNLFLIFKECITNIARHSHCTHVSVTVAVDRSSLSLQVQDDGVGFELLQESDGTGLVSMRRRAELHSGLCDVRSAPGRGTTVSIVLSLKAGARTFAPVESKARQSAETS